eukprot:GEMP01075490.1.p1 GENE.GEMP01075490.1~~GEMP01075490.1.p1  ORF type:complete len:220 (+),score=34.98 GEMP01075490.1:350-1009(+)
MVVSVGGGRLQYIKLKKTFSSKHDSTRIYDIFCNFFINDAYSSFLFCVASPLQKRIHVQKRRNAKCKDSNADSAVNPFITVREIMTKSPSNVMSKLMYNPSMEGTKSSRNSDQIAGLLNKLEAENMKAVGNEVDADEKEEVDAITPFYVNVQTITGISTKVESDPITSVRAVKEKMAELRNIDADSQMYVYGGRQMSDVKSLEDYKVRTGGVISLIMKL